MPRIDWPDCASGPASALFGSYHAEGERLPEYLLKHGLDKLSCERIVRTGRISSPEGNLDGQETVHVAGIIDGLAIEIVVCPKVVNDIEIAVIVTIKLKRKARRR